MPKVRVNRAIISVSNKTGLAEFARFLAEHNVEIISTGGTAQTMRDAGLQVVDVSDYTGFPEMMGGRLKTLHPKVHGGLLAIRENAEHVAAMEAHGIKPVDLLVVNLYPFEKTAAKEGVALEELVENIDVGGPAMIRAAAKNFASVGVVVDPTQYHLVLGSLKRNNMHLDEGLRGLLMAQAFLRTGLYDQQIGSHFTSLFWSKML